MTSAGATWPYGKDPNDNSIRIAPSYPSPQDLAVAAELFALCVNTLHMNDWLAKILLAVFNVVFNYVASKLVIFRKKDVKEEEN